MAKKIKVESVAELIKESSEESPKEESQATQAAPIKEEMVIIELPKFDNGRNVEIQINNRVYHGRCRVPLGVAQLLLEMSHKVQERERSVTSGEKRRSFGPGNRVATRGGVR